MKNFFKITVELITSCIGIGFIASKIEKKKGWTENHNPSFYEKNLKRSLDLGISILGIIFLWPIFLIIAVLVKIKLGSPVLFEQERPGLGGKVFKLQKFRTMTSEKDENGRLKSDEERMTKFGNKLRSMSLDELPELFNIIKGDMSIIGPRPLLVRYLSAYTVEELHRHDVRPGLTGLAQINGRNYIKWDERLALDVEYVNKITFTGDLIIFLKTIGKVIRKDDVAISADLINEGFLDEIRER